MGDDLKIVRDWLLKLPDLDLEDIVADGGVTSGMVVQQEAALMASKLSAILARAQGPGPGEAVADGWVMVPREPTEAMLLQGCKASLSMATLLDDTRFACERAVWGAMITATPPRDA